MLFPGMKVAKGSLWVPVQCIFLQFNKNNFQEKKGIYNIFASDSLVLCKQVKTPKITFNIWVASLCYCQENNKRYIVH